MDLINELHFMLSHKMPEEFDSLVPNNSKTRQLYDLVVEGKVKSDDEASLVIYKSEDAGKKYLMLKRNLVKKLCDLVFFQEYTGAAVSNYKSIQFNGEKELAIAEKLLSRNVYHNPTKIISKVEQTAEKHYLIALQVEAAKKLRSVYSLKGFPRETEQYHQKVLQLNVYHDYIIEAAGLWEMLYSKTKFSLAKTKSLIKECKGAYDKIKPWTEDYKSPFLRMYLYRIEVLLHYVDNQYALHLAAIQKLEGVVNEYPYLRTNALTLDIYFYYALHYRNVRKLEIAEVFLEKCLEMSDYRAFNKFLYQELNFDICIKQQEYHKAGQIIKEVYEVPQYHFLDKNDRSAWVIREAFLFFVYRCTDDDDNIGLLPSFSNMDDVKSFLDKAKKSGKDKYGYNINLLIIRMLILKLYGAIDIFNEGNNLSIYSHRYMKELNSERTLAFFKCLSNSAAAGFDPNKTAFYRQKMLQEFESKNPKVFDVFEIIPYEHFWEMIEEVFG